MIQSPGGFLLRDTCFHGGLASGILSLPGGQNLPQDDFIHFVGIDLGVFKSGLDRDCAELVGGCIGKRTVEGSNRCSGCRGDNDVLHILISLCSIRLR